MYREKRSKNYHIMAMVDVFWQWITSFYFLLNKFIVFPIFYNRHILIITRNNKTIFIHPISQTFFSVMLYLIVLRIDNSKKRISRAIS